MPDTTGWDAWIAQVRAKFRLDRARASTDPPLGVSTNVAFTEGFWSGYAAAIDDVECEVHREDPHGGYLDAAAARVARMQGQTE